LSGTSVTAEPPPGAAPRVGEPRDWKRYAIAVGFLAPAIVLLSVWVIYPTVYTFYRSFFSRSGESFVWLDNYKTLFTTSVLTTAIRNSAIWVAVVPAIVTAFGLIFAVLTERVSWAVAFKTAVFMPMAISLFAAGVIWRIMDQQDPSLGAVNAGLAAVHDTFKSPGPLPSALPSTPTLTGSPEKGLTLQTELHPGDTARMGLTGIAPANVPAGAKQAVDPQPKQGQITGVVWRK